jgi:hypothetical protein
MNARFSGRLCQRAMRLALALCLLSGCHDWGALSEGDGGEGGGADVGGGGGSAAGGGTGLGGGSMTGGGSATGGGTATGGGSAAGGGTATGGGSAAGGGTPDPTSCSSRGAFTCPAALFCDGFDEMQFNSAWAVDQSNGAITDADACKYRGTRAAHALLNPLPPSVKGHATITEVDSGTPGDFYVRAFVRVESGLANATHLIAVRPASPSTDELFLFYAAGGNLGVAGTVSTPSATAPFSLHRWTCVEWQLTGSQMHVWLDNTDVIDGPYTLAGLERVVLGAQVEDHSANLDAGTEAWFDDLVVSTSRIGCD